MQLWKLGCRWGSNTPLFYDFIVEKSIAIGYIDKDYQIDDWLLITDGHTVLSFAKILSKRTCVLNYPDLQTKIEALAIPFNSELFIYDASFIHLKNEDQFNYPLQQGIVRVQGQEYINTFNNLRRVYMQKLTILEIVSTLNYKKQIILQGPPGTGKTRLAKEIADSLCKPKTINNDDILNTLNLGLHICTPTNYNTFELTLITNDLVKVQPKNAQNDYTVSFADIIISYNEKQWESPVSANNTSGNASYKIGIAKYIFDKIKQDNCKLIQFHPAYSYEDFVRGITAKSNGTQVEYETENRVLAKFANDAFDNYRKSKIISDDELSKEQWIDASWLVFVSKIENEVALNGFYKLTEKVNITEVEDDCFRYKGDEWKNISRINFNDCKKLIKKYIDKGDGIVSFDSKESKHAFYRQTYYTPILQKFVSENKYEKIAAKKEELKNYVLIIDEINRANLPAVLGELIYALEYRGDAVESMYAIKGDNKLILPPNLYIIGTMNTADRSVGHIDYAIRRRFAFVDVLPTNEPIKEFAKPTFEKVSKLFIKNYDNIDWSNPTLEKSDHLAADFKPEEVWLGHSYFITKEKEENGLSEEQQLSTKLKYEVVPILKEYVKDGILLDTVEVKNIINGLS